ncbi:MAG: hypothetical protein EOM24_10905 [Chloroflexia bacterium]|nr:hypothetical protein [Chloroflexia bacterium]
MMAFFLAIITPTLGQTKLTQWILNTIAMAWMTGTIIWCGLIRFDELKQGVAVISSHVRRLHAHP